MNHLARTGAVGAVLTLAGLSLTPVAAVAKGGPSIAQIEHQERVAAAANHPTKAQIEYVERTSLTASHPTKAQIEYVERTNAVSPTSQSPVQAQPVSDNGDAAAWQLAVSAAVGALLTGGVVLASRGMNRQRHAMAG